MRACVTRSRELFGPPVRCSHTTGRHYNSPSTPGRKPPPRPGAPMPSSALNEHAVRMQQRAVDQTRLNRRSVITVKGHCATHLRDAISALTTRSCSSARDACNRVRSASALAFARALSATAARSLTASAYAASPRRCSSRLRARRISQHDTTRHSPRMVWALRWKRARPLTRMRSSPCW